MRRHLPVLAHAFRFYAAWIGALSTMVALGVFAFLTALDSVALGLLGILPIVGMGSAIALAYAGVARGLDARRPWARWAGLALSVLVISDLPVGMALGLLGVGVLTDDEVADAFAAPAPRPLLTERA